MVQVSLPREPVALSRDDSAAELVLRQGPAELRLAPREALTLAAGIADAVVALLGAAEAPLAIDPDALDGIAEAPSCR